MDKPRILYVPEEVPTSQAPLADIQIAPEERAPRPVQIRVVAVHLA